jgi:hypothetical protein
MINKAEANVMATRDPRAELKKRDADDRYPLANLMALTLTLTHGNLVP